MLDVRDLSVWFGAGDRLIHVLKNVSFTIPEKSVVGLVGESGSGKSITVLSILNLLDADAQVKAEKLSWSGRSLLSLSDSEMRVIRGREIGLIFQNPLASLNPVYSIGRQFVETIQYHQGCDLRTAKDLTFQALRDVSISDPEKRFHDFPHQFSLGMCQRLMIALTLAMSPKLLIADEPTASLDVTVQAQIMQLIQEKRLKNDMSVLLISHDLGMVAQHCDQIMVMYLGQIVEMGCTKDIFKSPKHPYTQALIASIPIPDPTVSQVIPSLQGEIPSPIHRPKGCAFHPRCAYATARCKEEMPDLIKVSETHRVACPVLNTPIQ